MIYLFKPCILCMSESKAFMWNKMIVKRYIYINNSIKVVSIAKRPYIITIDNPTRYNYLMAMSRSPSSLLSTSSR